MKLRTNLELLFIHVIADIDFRIVGESPIELAGFEGLGDHNPETFAKDQFSKTDLAMEIFLYRLLRFSAEISLIYWIFGVDENDAFGNK